MSEKDALQSALDWGIICCPQFEYLLYHNAKTDVYVSEGTVIEKDDPRLVEFLEKSKMCKPVDGKMMKIYE